MPTGILDSFQIVVALYLFYIAFKGSGQMYRFGDMDEETQQQIRTPLRLLYAAGGLIALIEFGLCCLQNSMFTRTGGRDRRDDRAELFHRCAAVSEL